MIFKRLINYDGCFRLDVGSVEFTVGRRLTLTLRCN